MQVLIVASVLLVAMGLRCHGNNDVEPATCLGRCKKIYGRACRRECGVFLVEVPEQITQCQEACRRELSNCTADCVSVYRGKRWQELSRHQPAQAADAR
ncbi:hypothetical protein NP493_364g00001 [Ridgeia piscesae]|uniref:Uncharacterized protein n=1 Tax=Ridgeia piscesae TaxID=27915 RepID=A0AAD9L2G4_RIDPI|nr:hypothetical protein NP493_364g00001 [Ridgeia piscesae]